jgi:hypothetical protein
MFVLPMSLLYNCYYQRKIENLEAVIKEFQSKNKEQV